MGSSFMLLLLFLPVLWAKPMSTVKDGQPDESQMDEALQNACISGDVDFIIGRMLTFGRAAVTQARAAEFQDKTSPQSIRNVTCLIMAAYQNHEKLAKVLIAAGSDVNAGDYFGGTPLLWALGRYGIDHFFKNGADDTILALLIKSGADVNARGQIDMTPLHMAAAFGCYRQAKLLIEKGAVVNARDSEGRTPLFLGALSGSYSTTKLLIEKGADVNARGKDYDGFNETPLMAAFYEWKKNERERDWGLLPRWELTKTILLLIKNGADLNATSTQNGRNALCYAASLGLHEAIAELIYNDAAINSASDNGDTPLLCIVKHYEDPEQASKEDSNYERSVKLLLAAGATVDAQDKDGATPLTYAISHQKIRLIKILLEAAFVQAVKEAEAAYLKAVKEVKKAYVKKSITVKGGKFDTEKFNKAMQNPDVLKALGLEKNSSNVKTTNANSIE